VICPFRAGASNLFWPFSQYDTSAPDIADTVHVFGQDKRLAASGTTEEILGNHALLQANNPITA
jgi:hypothetical protein